MKWGCFGNRCHTTCITLLEEQSLLGHKLIQGRLKLFLKRMQAFMWRLSYHWYTIARPSLPLCVQETECEQGQTAFTRGTSAKIWATRQLCMRWLHEMFAPTIKKYFFWHLTAKKGGVFDGQCSSTVLNFDWCWIWLQRYQVPPPQQDASSATYGPESDLQLQEAVQKGILHQKIYVTEKASFILKEFWRKHFNVVQHINFIYKAWEFVIY